MARKRPRMFWWFFFMNVAIAATLVWSISTFRKTTTYRMDVRRLPQLDDAVDKVNAGANSSTSETAVGRTADDFISLGSAYDAGLAEIGRRGDVAVFVRQGTPSVIDLYVTPVARYELSQWSGSVEGSASLALFDGRLYGIQGARETGRGVIGTFDIPSGAFVPFARDGGLGTTHDVRGAHAILPTELGVFFMTGCAQHPCNVFRYDLEERTVTPIAIGLEDAQFGALRMHTYDAPTNTLRMLYHDAEGETGTLTEYNLNGETGQITEIATWTYGGACDTFPTGNPPPDSCSSDDIMERRAYWERAIPLGLWEPTYMKDSGDVTCGGLEVAYDERRGRFLGCLEYDPAMWAAVQSATLELDGTTEGSNE